MPQLCMLPRSRVLRDTFAINSAPLLDFLTPSLPTSRTCPAGSKRRSYRTSSKCDRTVETDFFAALNTASLCGNHKKNKTGQSWNHHNHTTSLHNTRRHVHSLRHQRFDSKGRLIVETTAAKHPAFPHTEYEDGQFFDQNDQEFAATTRLPASFFSDLSSIRKLTPLKGRDARRKADKNVQKKRASSEPDISMDARLKLIQSVRDLEEKLEKAKKALDDSISPSGQPANNKLGKGLNMTVLTKQDYLNLVDLYFYSHNSRFSPESSDSSPTPIILDDYSFTLSADFTTPEGPDIEHEVDENYISPLKSIAEHLKNTKLREIAVMQVFVDLLLQDDSPNRSLYEAYQQLPQPGVSYLPRGVLRLFLQRMSTPWIKTQASKLRYLSLIDDMQQANLPITAAEWSSAIYLAGRSFCRIELDEVNRAFHIWKTMETEAGVRSSHVTFNILFDVAVRAGKFALGEAILNEMHKRNLRLNRMGRVSLMYYHGLRGDGDGVRKAYHDFVEAGEIVDTLVLNCVIASLINAQEPTAAEQIYQRMKDMQTNFRKGWHEDGHDTLFRRHPAPTSDRIGDEMASNSLGRILLKAPNLRRSLPQKHQELQASMPLTPDFTTFRIMLAYHSGVSGDLDRMTVLLSDMLENFDIPLFPVVFQLLFKGFAIHGPKGGPDSKWSKLRLEMAWQACRTAIKDAQDMSTDKEFLERRDLPSSSDVRTGMSFVTQAEALGQSKTRTLSMWETLVVDLAAFPRERLRRLQRYHNEQFDENVSNFTSPFFQQAHYDAPQPNLDAEEGEYTLPSPYKSVVPDSKQDMSLEDSEEDLGPQFGLNEPQLNEDEELDRPPSHPQETFSFSAFSALPRSKDLEQNVDGYRLRASKPLVCWLLRAYSRVTGSRELVEEVWNSVRKIWRPRDDVEAQVVVKVLLRCLKDCDRVNGSTWSGTRY